MPAVPFYFTPFRTIDKTDSDSSQRGRPSAVVRVSASWFRIQTKTPWRHLRYHSTYPIDEGLYQTLHVLLPLEDPYFRYLPLHRPQRLDEGYIHPRIGAAAVEISRSKDAPQYSNELTELLIFYKNRRHLPKKEPTEVLRRDFVTDQPLVFSEPEEVRMPWVPTKKRFRKSRWLWNLPDLTELDFREIPYVEATGVRLARLKSERTSIPAQDVYAGACAA